MKVIIMGCGRVGAWLARLLDADGHQVTVLDTDSYSFRRLKFPGLETEFKGTALVGNGIDQEALKKAGIEEADVFFALTQGDNRNIMSTQIAKHIFNVPRVICR
ncbi:potassium channel family protein, partial [Chloroflexota bacterium]